MKSDEFFCPPHIPGSAQVAVNRLLFTAHKDYCLVDIAMPLAAVTRDRISAFLCTLVGGPVTMEGCYLPNPTYIQNGTANLTALWWRLYSGHLGYVLGAPTHVGCT